MYNAGNIKIQTNTIQPMMKLINEGSNMVELSSVTIRYYYTMEEEAGQIFTCDWSSYGSDVITASFHKLEEGFKGADSYVEIGFTDDAGFIGIGTAINIHSRIYKENWGSYDPAEDFSMNPVSEYIDWDKVDIYINGEKVWGRDLLPADEEEPEDRIDYADNTYLPLRVAMYNQNRDNRTNNISPSFILL